MKKLAAILCLTALTTGAFAQGLIKFANSATTLVSVNGALMPANAGTPATTYYFALLSAPTGTTDRSAFAYSGLLATNVAVAGRLQGGSLLGVTANSTWGANVTRDFFVAGWSADLGATWNQSWLTTLPLGAGFFGVSPIAAGTSGGTDPVTQQTFPAMAVFSGTTLGTGFNLVPVPEPTTMALAGLGATALLIFRRRN